MYNAGVNPVYVNGQMWPSAAGVLVFELSNRMSMLELVTGRDGLARTDADALPVGTYIIREVRAPVGYLLNDEFAEGVTFRVTSEGEVVSFTEFSSVEAEG